MNRLFSILVSLFILFLVYLWINHITQRDNNNSQLQTEQQPSITPEDSESKPTTKSPVPPFAEEATEESQSAPIQEETTPDRPREQNKAIESSGEQVAHLHLVVAGNFLERANAEKHLKSVRDLGYSKAEILNFEISQYYTVIAGRYEDLAEARRVAKKLKDMHGVDTYVRNAN